MSTHAAPLGLRLFLEGVEVPCIAAQVSIQPSNPSSATIQIIPTDSSLLFLPRTLVHLFFLDDELTAADRSRLDKAGDYEVDHGVDRFDVEDDRYRLLFCGEIIGYNYSKDPSSRSMVIQCLDLSSYWDTCYQWFADYSVGGSGLTDKTHNIVGAGRGLFDNIASGTKWVIGNILNSPPENPAYRDAKGLLGGFIHLLESIGGVRPHKGTYKGIRGVNDFFTVAELLYNLTGMVGAIEADNSSPNMFASHAFRDWLKNGMTSAGSLVSYRDAVRLVGQYIFHDVYPNPAAMYTEGKTTTKEYFGSVYADAPLGKEITALLKGALTDLTQASVNLSTIQTVGGQARITLADSMDLLVKVETALNKALDLLVQTKSSDATRVGVEVRNGINVMRESQINLWANSRVDSETKELVGTDALFVRTSKKLDTAKASMNVALKSRSTRKVKKKSKVFTGNHLFNQLILPETFFLVPPRCNVIFPDQVTTFSFNRNYLREVTRLSCQGGLGIIGMGRRGAGILGRHYIAPNVRDVRGKLARNTLYSSSQTLLPHEIHSGIIPKFEWVTDGHRWGIKAAKATGKGKEAAAARISYVQRLANYQFFIHRWSARTMSCNMRFNPYIVLGFPGLVIDRSVPSAAAIQMVGEALGTSNTVFPTAYLGKVAAVSHDINQGGGTTSVNFSHCRTHRSIDDEFLGVLQTEGLVREIKTSTTHRDKKLDVKAILASGLNRSGTLPGGDAILLETFMRGTLDNSRIDLEKIVKVTEKAGSPPVLVTREAFLEAGGNTDVFDSYYLHRGDSGGSASSVATNSSLTDTIELPALITIRFVKTFRSGKNVQVTDKVPPEIALRPSWYDKEVWQNSAVTGSVYQPLLGTMAITDDEAVSDPAQFKELVNEMFKTIGEGPSAKLVEDDNGGLSLVVNDVAITSFNLNRPIDPETGNPLASTSEQAIDGLTLIFGLLKQRDLNSHQFINDYIKRPIATLPEVLGSSGISLVDGELSAEDQEAGKREGFHSRAFGDYNTVVSYRVDTDTGLVEPQAGVDAMKNLIPENSRAAYEGGGTVADRKAKLDNIPSHIDPRGRARQRVLSYARELELSRGLLAT